MLNMITLIGLASAFCTTAAFLPQAIKTIKTKKTRDLSLKMYLLQGTGNLLWIVYGFLIRDIPLIISNIITSFFVITTLFFILKYQARPLEPALQRADSMGEEEE